ncbi:VOC family protein [Chitiniphilus eburneus]|uniref:VOC family protein n=1 Tax=Chitiniphilus eburneus TaxID=2571148 RepID=A0A4U0QDG9_9NEIS|nr:VOC family protein [Chitiniphilus eburneus]TJZ79190.1 VOC family protein [Chitiniphilus eburneus]
MQVQAYLFFNGQCDEALRFYVTHLGARVNVLLRYRDSPEPAQVSEGWLDKVMHASLHIGESELFASDGLRAEAAVMQGVSLHLTAESTEHGRQMFDALADGGQITTAYAPTFWAAGFGMVTDRFGAHWMVSAPSV